MMEKKYEQKAAGYCLECGDAFTSAYGRADKKFCCPQCRSNYHYRAVREARVMRLRITTRLERNHEILSDLLARGITSITRLEAKQLGLDLDFMTSCVVSKTKVECSCFDITYRITASRITNISKCLTNFGVLKIK